MRGQQADFTGQDRLLSATRYREAADARVARQEESVRKDIGLILEAQRNDIAQSEMDLRLRNEQKVIEQQKLQLWQENEKATASSYAAAALPKIDVRTPEGEQELGNWVSYVKAKGVSDQEMDSIFGVKLRESKVYSELRTQSQVQALGEEGLDTYDSFKSMGLDSRRASRLARNSIQAKDQLSGWQKLAEENDIPFIVTSEDLSSMRKRIGPQDSVIDGSGGGTFDAAPYAYDLDGVNAFLSRTVTPELRKLAQRQDAASERTVRAEEQKIALDAAKTKEAEANAKKATWEASLYGDSPIGAPSSSGRRDPGVDLFNF
jgi:hypothetical protein